MTSTRNPRAFVATELAQLEPFRQQWDAMALAAGLPFCTPAWMWNWWAHAAPADAVLRVVLITDADELVGVAPLFAETHRAVRRYRLLGAGTSARMDMISLPGREAEVATSVARSLATNRPRPNVIVFEGTPADSPWPQLLTDNWPGRLRPRLFEDVSIPAPVLPLNLGSYDDWFMTKGSHFRARIRRGFRKLEAMEGQMRLAATDEEFEKDIRSFAELHHARWKERGGSGVLTPGVERMLQELARDPDARDRLQIWSIDVGDRTVSAQIFFAAGGEVTYWLGGFDESLRDLRPGPAILTVVKAIEHGYAAGHNRVDLGSGDQAYKYEFAETQDVLHWVTLTPWTLRYPLARAQLLPMRLRIAAAKRLTPKAKKRLKAIRKKVSRS